MGSPSTIITLFLFFSYNLIGMVRSDDSLINTLCSKTEEPVICKACQQADSNSKSADGQGLALIALSCAERDTTYIHEDTFNLLQNATGKLKGILDDCAEYSFLAQQDFPPVAHYVQEHYYDTAKDAIAEEIIPFVIHCNCKKLFDQTPELPVPF